MTNLPTFERNKNLESLLFHQKISQMGRNFGIYNSRPRRRSSIIRRIMKVPPLTVSLPKPNSSLNSSLKSNLFVPSDNLKLSTCPDQSHNEKGKGFLGKRGNPFLARNDNVLKGLWRSNTTDCVTFPQNTKRVTSWKPVSSFQANMGNQLFKIASKPQIYTHGSAKKVDSETETIKRRASRSVADRKDIFSEGSSCDSMLPSSDLGKLSLFGFFLNLY